MVSRMDKVYLVWLTAGRSHSATLVTVYSTRKAAKAFIDKQPDLKKSLSIQEVLVLHGDTEDVPLTE
jgi:hypothetical protein